MKRKLLFLICAMLLGSISAVKAGDVKRDITSSYLKNPTFDSNINDWTNDGFEHHAANNVQYNTGFAQKWSDQIREGSISQTITNLPAGTYRVTANCIGGTKETDGSNEYDYLYVTRTNGGTTKTDVEWISGDLANLRTLDFTNSEKQNVTIGFKANQTKWWSAIDNVQLWAVDLATAAYDLPNGNGNVTADSWYKFTTGSSSDVYILSSNGTATITYTTDGTITNDDGISTTWALTAKQNILLAPSTTYYVKSNAAVTLTESESSVSSSYVSGWTKVTSLETLRTNPENYFYAIFSANDPAFILDASSSNTYKEPYYKTAANPLSSSAYLFELENYGESGGFAMKSVSMGKYFANSSDDPWNYQATKTTVDGDCEITMTLANGVYTLQDKYTDDGKHYLGLWTPGNGYKNGERLAGNKGDAEKGSFLIYRIAKDGLNMTSLITNPSFESDNAAASLSSGQTSPTGWTAVYNEGFTENSQWGTASSSTTLSSGGFTSFAPSDGDKYYYIRTNWNAGQDFGISQTLNNLPAGCYRLTCRMATYASAATTTYTLSLKEGENTPVSRSTTTAVDSWTKWELIIVKESSTSPLTIKANMNAGEAATGRHFQMLLDDFQLTYSTPAEASDYASLNTAIATAEANILGFEDGEYAPYNNVDALTKLATAKAINQSDTNPKIVVTEATTAISTASWTANSGDVDAIYNQDFSEGGWDPTAWTSSGWAAKVTDINSSNTISKTGKGWRPNPGTITYGNTGVYTMPLAGNQLYKLTFKYGAWDNWSVPTISVLNAEDGLSATALPGTSTNYKTEMNTWTMYFKTGAAGNYILSMNASANMVWTDVSLVKADASETTLSSGNIANKTFFQNLTLGGRTFSADNWNTLCVPFAFDKSSFASVKELTAIELNGDNITMTFSEASTIKAGKPYLVKANSNGDGLTATNVTMPGESVRDSYATGGGYRVDFVGTYTNTTIDSETADGNAWVVSRNKFWNVDNEVTVGAYRAYFTVTGTSVKALVFGDEETGITNLNVNDNLNKNEAIYNLAGQRVQKAQKGLYIVNGRKVVVK